MGRKDLPYTRSPEELRQRLAGDKRLSKHAEALVAAGRDGLRLTQTDAESADGRLGGQPDLPVDVEWPEWKSKPLAFLAQLDLAQVPERFRPRGLPESGLLSFFALIADRNGYGSFFERRGQWRVVHTPAGTPVVPRKLPKKLEDEARLRPQPVAMTVDWTPAECDAMEVMELPLGSKGYPLDRYDRLVGEQDEPETIHRFLGQPDRIQDDPVNDLDFLYDLDVVKVRKRREMIRAGEGDPHEWRLLLQVDSDEEGLGTMIGDVGRMYWLIRDDHLVAGRLDEVLVVTQC